jgi:hypothetical protein
VNDSLTALRYDALSRQLERMRGMQYGYFTKFFSWVIVTGFTFVLIYLAPFPGAQMVLPFWVVTAGVQASFYLHFVDFARVHARALEERLNVLLEEEVLVASRLEDAYFYPLEKPKFSGLVLTRPTTFFSAYTTHWVFVWAFFYLFGALQAWEAAGTYRFFYFLLLGSWSALNVGYLAWYFIRQRDEKRIAAMLREAYRLPEA